VRKRQTGAERTDLDSSVSQNALSDQERSVGVICGSDLIEIAAEAEGFEFRWVAPFDLLIWFPVGVTSWIVALFGCVDRGEQWNPLPR
jgi:hypothetical protein